MTELCEPIALAVINEFDNQCPFHEEHKECSDSVNILEGDANKLGVSLHKAETSTVNNNIEVCEKFKSLSDSKEEDPEDETVFSEYDQTDNDRYVNLFDDPTKRPNAEYPIGFQAHHLIPADGSLNKCEELLKFIEEKKGHICCNLGYNVNGAENGLWLPGKHPVQAPAKKAENDVENASLNLWNCAGTTSSKKDKEPGTRKTVERCKEKYELLVGSKKVLWNDQNLKWKYVLKAMTFFPKTDKKGIEHKKNRQFHESHSKYNTIVQQSLQTFAVHLEGKAGNSDINITCNKCKNKMKKKKIAPPYRLLSYLNKLSNHYKGILSNTEHERIFTSSWCDAQKIKTSVKT